jgi:hypothetical protein
VKNPVSVSLIAMQSHTPLAAAIKIYQPSGSQAGPRWQCFSQPPGRKHPAVQSEWIAMLDGLSE